MRQKLSSKRFLRIINFFLKLFLIIIIIVISFLTIFNLNKIFLVKKIDIVSNSDNKNIRGIDIKNKNIFLISETELQNKIISENSFINAVDVKKVYPDKLIITINFNTPLAVLKVNVGYLILDNEGRIISKQKENNTQLPLINYYQQLNYYSLAAGDWISFKDIITCLKLLKISLDIGLKIDTIDINGLDMLLFNLSEKKIYFTTKKEVQTQAYELETITHQFKIAGKDFVSLDLRFEKPIVVFKN